MRLCMGVLAGVLLLCAGLSVRGQSPGGSNEVTVGSGWFRSGWTIDDPYLSAFEGIYGPLRVTGAPPLWIAFNHRFQGPWALDTSLLLARVAMESEYWFVSYSSLYYRLPDLKHEIGVATLSVCLQYHFARGHRIDPYVGVGPNLMLARHGDEVAGRFVRPSGLYKVQPTARGSLGWVLQAGVAYRFTSRWSARVEAQYIRNGVFLKEYQYLGAGHYAWWEQVGYLRANLDPLVALAGLSVSW